MYRQAAAFSFVTLASVLNCFGRLGKCYEVSLIYFPTELEGVCLFRFGQSVKKRQSLKTLLIAIEKGE